jgi:hypothetical protein
VRAGLEVSNMTDGGIKEELIPSCVSTRRCRIGSLRQPLDHHCGNHEDPSDGDDVNASALVIGHVGSGAFRGRPIVAMRVQIGRLVIGHNTYKGSAWRLDI